MIAVVSAGIEVQKSAMLSVFRVRVAPAFERMRLAGALQGLLDAEDAKSPNPLLADPEGLHQFTTIKRHGEARRSHTDHVSAGSATVLPEAGRELQPEPDAGSGPAHRERRAKPAPWRRMSLPPPMAAKGFGANNSVQPCTAAIVSCRWQRARGYSRAGRAPDCLRKPHPGRRRRARCATIARL